MSVLAASDALAEVKKSWDHISHLPTFSNMKNNRINQHIYKLLTADLTTAPDPKNLIACAGKQLQRAAAYAVLDQERNALVTDMSLPKHTRARVAQAAAKGAGRFLMVLPGTALRFFKREEVILQDSEWRDNVDIRLGCSLACRLHEGTTCGCKKTPADFSSSSRFFDHVLGCAQGTHGAVYDRHELLAPVFQPFFEKLGYKWDVRDSSLQFSQALHSAAQPGQHTGKKKLDAVAHYRQDSRLTRDIDFSCVHATSASYCESEQACSVADSATFATRISEGKKAEKYADLCTVRGHMLLPIVLNTFGGFGEKIMEFVDEYFNAKRAEEREATGQEWNALGERELLFQRAGVAVARGNSIVLNSLDHSWCVSDSKRKKASSISASESHKNTLAAAKFLADLTLNEQVVKAVRRSGFSC